MLPARPLAAVVERRLAVQAHLSRAVHAPDRPEQDVLGVVVGRRPDVRAVCRVLVQPRPHHQAVPHDDPAAPAVPAGLQDHGPGQVAPVGGDGRLRRAEAEHAGVPVQQRAEHARAVQPRQAHPLDCPARRHQRGDLAVRQERVVGDRRVRRELIEPAGRPRPGTVRPRVKRHRIRICHPQFLPVPGQDLLALVCPSRPRCHSEIPGCQKGPSFVLVTGDLRSRRLPDAALRHFNRVNSTVLKQAGFSRGRMQRCRANYRERGKLAP